MRTAIYITVFVVFSVITAFVIRFGNVAAKNKSEKKQISDIKISDKWELPDILKEVSGIDYAAEGKLACVQDELGKIFIYDLLQKKIEKEISFAGAGDYEGLAIAGNTAYVLRSDGKLYEVINFMNSAKILQYNTSLNASNDTEGLAYDFKNNRLLIAIKGYEDGQKEYKGVYSFDLKTKTMQSDPVYRIDLGHPILKDFKPKKKGASFNPSDIAIHPNTGEIYIIEGAKPKLLVMNSSGNIKNVKSLDSKDGFSQPEGIAFSPDGKLYISNEGKKQPGNILLINN